ncbi:MAG: DeoR/GlpR family DNA-binding transcription regulator [Chloroflexota bacterium]
MTPGVADHGIGNGTGNGTGDGNGNGNGNGARSSGAARPRLDLSPEDRRDRIAAAVLSQDVVIARDLAAAFGVSLMTIHRDLDELEARGILRKTRGGATAQPSSLFESSVLYRASAMLAEKQAISRHALGLIESGQSVMLSDATTLLPLVERLPGLAPLTVIASFLPAIEALKGREHIRLIALGGEYLPTHDSFAGILCESAIASLRADICFISVSAVSGGYAYHQEQEIVAVMRAMLRSSTRKVLLIDHGKLGKTALHRVAPLSDFDLVVVDSGVGEDGLRELRDARTPFEIAPMGGGD